MIVPLEEDDEKKKRGTIIAIVSEWYLLPKLRMAVIKGKDELPSDHPLRKISHGPRWSFWYDEINNVIYL